MADSIQKIIDSWLVDIGGSVPIRDARRPLVINLYASFAHHGYSEEECSSQRVKSLVIGVCVPHNCKPKKRPGWEKAVEKDIRVAIATEWKSELVESDKPVAVPKKYTKKQEVKQESKEDSAEPEKSFVRVSRDPDPEWLATLPQPEVEYDDEEFFKLLRGVK